MGSRVVVGAALPLPSSSPPRCALRRPVPSSSAP